MKWQWHSYKRKVEKNMKKTKENPTTVCVCHQKQIWQTHKRKAACVSVTMKDAQTEVIFMSDWIEEGVAKNLVLFTINLSVLNRLLNNPNSLKIHSYTLHTYTSIKKTWLNKYFYICTLIFYLFYQWIIDM